MLTLAASHFPVIGPGIVPLMVGLVLAGSWLGTRGIDRDDD